MAPWPHAVGVMTQPNLGILRLRLDLHDVFDPHKTLMEGVRNKCLLLHQLIVVAHDVIVVAVQSVANVQRFFQSERSPEHVAKMIDEIALRNAVIVSSDESIPHIPGAFKRAIAVVNYVAMIVVLVSSKPNHKLPS